ncbi:DUF2242 domain-containing protein [Burkholderia multivorans]|uniref:DUF2242 domain-containing protein n=1 Tax=Burkholderia multivorans TaxID=87883 RepID=UPI0020B3A311|nr:DUF2242 domain-containing protein [Burkholderia multivorans]
MTRAALAALPCAAALTVLAAGCASPKAAYEQENFAQSTTSTYSRAYDVPPARACDAGRRALLSQGYNIDKFQADTVAGHKNFVDEDKANTQITVTVNCIQGGGEGKALVFANAVQDNYSVKKSSNSASVGVSVLGQVSLPFGSIDDSLVKTSSLTVTREAFYGGFFDLLQHYLPQSGEASPAQPASASPGGQPAAPQPGAAPASGGSAAPGSPDLSPANTGVSPPAAPASAPAD